MNPNELRLSWQNYLKAWDWELHITIRFKTAISTDSAFKQSKSYLRKIHKTYPVKFGGMIFLVSNSAQDVHAHILLVSQHRKIQPASLLDLPTGELLFLCDHDCHISTRNEWSSTDTIIKYVTKEKNFPLLNPYKEHHESEFRPGVLKKLKNNMSRKVIKPA